MDFDVKTKKGKGVIMAEYKSNQCPECGCEKFERRKETILLYKFAGMNPDFTVLNITDSDYKTALECYDCCAKINNIESIKQGKIVLMG